MAESVGLPAYGPSNGELKNGSTRIWSPSTVTQIAPSKKVWKILAPSLP